MLRYHLIKVSFYDTLLANYYEPGNAAQACQEYAIL
jgi:hypothetical protein